MVLPNQSIHTHTDTDFNWISFEWSFTNLCFYSLAPTKTRMKEINSNKSHKHTKFCRIQRNVKFMMKAANQPLRKVAAVEPAFQAQWTYSTCSSVVVSVVAGKLSFIRSISFTLAPIDVRIHTIFNYELLLKFIAIENILLIKETYSFFSLHI